MVCFLSLLVLTYLVAALCCCIPNNIYKSWKEIRESDSESNSDQVSQVSDADDDMDLDSGSNRSESESELNLVHGSLHGSDSDREPINNSGESDVWKYNSR